MQIIDCYAAKFNSDWNKGNEMKHALYDGICQWLRRIGQAWIKTGVPWWRLCRHFIQNLVGHDMVTVTLNHSLPLLILMQILKVVVHVNVGLHSHEQYRKSLVALCSLSC